MSSWVLILVGRCWWPFLDRGGNNVRSIQQKCDASDSINSYTRGDATALSLFTNRANKLENERPEENSTSKLHLPLGQMGYRRRKFDESFARVLGHGSGQR